MKSIANLKMALALAGFLAPLPICWSAHAAGPSEAAGPTELDQPGQAEFYGSAQDPLVDPAFGSIYTGYEFNDDANFYYAGFLAALNGDLSRPGFLVQGLGGFGDYDYLNSFVPGGKVNADLTEVSGLIGYQFFSGNVRFRGFAGVDWQENDLSPPDPANPVSGDETDFIATASIENVDPQPVYFKLSGSYSVVNETYWSKARIGYDFGSFVIGPEGAFYGNENFNSQQAGAFVKIPVLDRLDVTVAGGFNFVANDEFFEELGTVSFGGLGGITDSGYGSVSLSTWF